MVRCILAMIAVFVSWSVLDFVIHGVLLKSTYEATVEMWRPEKEMKMGLMSVVTLIAAIAFTSIYCCLVDGKTSRLVVSRDGSTASSRSHVRSAGVRQSTLSCETLRLLKWLRVIIVPHSYDP